MSRKKKIEGDFDMEAEEFVEVEVTVEEQPEPELPEADFVLTDEEAEAWLRSAWRRAVSKYKTVRFDAVGVPEKKQIFLVSLLTRAVKRRGVLIVPDQLAPVVTDMKEAAKIGGYVVFSKE